MDKKDLFVQVYRTKESWTYKKNPSGKDDWHNNDYNNMLDTFTVLDKSNNKILMSCKVQSVANAAGLIKGARLMDTIAPGPFQVRAFVNRRSFKSRIHGIVNAKTIGGEWIMASVNKVGIPDDNDSTTEKNKDRWLVHDLKNHDGVDCRVAWSSGCLIMADADLVKFGDILYQYNVMSGDLIDGTLIQGEDVQ